MSDRDRIVTGVARLRRLRRLQLALELAIRGLLWGALAAALVILTSKLWLIPVEPLVVAAIVAALGLVAGIVVAFLRPPSALTVANEIDNRLGLRERVSSALALGIDSAAASETASKRGRDPFVKALIHDAAKAVHNAELKRVFPWQMPSAWRSTAIAILLAAGLTFVPQLSWLTKENDRAEAKQVQNEGEKLKELAKQLKKEAEKKKDPVLKQQAKEVKRTGEKLDKPSVKKKEALKELKKLEEKLKEQQTALIPEGEKKLTEELGKQLQNLKSTQELGKLLNDGKTTEFSEQLKEMLQNMQSGKMSAEQTQQMKDLLQALDQALKSQSAKSEDAQALKQQLEQMQQALKSAQDMKDQLGKTLQDLQKDVNELTQEMQKQSQAQMSQEAQQLNQQMQQMMQQFAQQGKLDQKTIENMHQQLKNAQSKIQNSQKLSQQQKDQLGKQCQQCLNYFEGREGQEGKEGQQGSMSQMNDQLARQMAQMQQMAQKQGECMGGACQGGAGGQLTAQIAAIQQSLGMGQYLSQTQGKAGSGWGIGSTPYGAEPQPAPNQAKVENREGKAAQGDVNSEQYTGLYAPNEYAHSAQDKRVQGKMDLTKPPEKIEEVRSAPEDQKALREYSGAVSAYAEGEEEAINREQVPLEYQDLVRQYFDEIKKDSRAR